MEEETNGNFSNIEQNQRMVYPCKVNWFCSTGDQEPGFKVNPKMSNSQFGNGGHDDGSATAFVGELDWWTTDAEVEYEACKYGNVKEVKFYEEKMNGKSKGYCKVLFYLPSDAVSCRDGMNGHLFNGRKCAVQCSRPFFSNNNNNKKKYDHGDQVVVKTNGIIWRKEYVPRCGGSGQETVRNGVANWLPCKTGQGFGPSNVAPYVSANGTEGNGKKMWYEGDPALDYLNGNGNHDREGWPNAVREKDRALGRDVCDSYNRQFWHDRNHKSGSHVPREKDNWSWRFQRRFDDKELEENAELLREGDRDWEKGRERECIQNQDREQHRDIKDREGDRYIDELFADLSILDQPPELPLSLWSSIR